MFKSVLLLALITIPLTACEREPQPPPAAHVRAATVAEQEAADRVFNVMDNIGDCDWQNQSNAPHRTISEVRLISRDRKTYVESDRPCSIIVVRRKSDNARQAVWVEGHEFQVAFDGLESSEPSDLYIESIAYAPAKIPIDTGTSQP